MGAIDEFKNQTVEDDNRIDYLKQHVKQSRKQLKKIMLIALVMLGGDQSILFLQVREK